MRLEVVNQTSKFTKTCHQTHRYAVSSFNCQFGTIIMTRYEPKHINRSNWIGSEKESEKRERRLLTKWRREWIQQLLCSRWGTLLRQHTSPFCFHFISFGCCVVLCFAMQIQCSVSDCIESKQTLCCSSFFPSPHSLPFPRALWRLPTSQIPLIFIFLSEIIRLYFAWSS